MNEKEDKDMKSVQPLQQSGQKQTKGKEMRKKLIRSLTKKACDRNDEALRRLSKK